MPDMKRSLTIDEVPDVHKEPYVLTGYRPPQQPWRFYLMSIFSQHNETVNVWTHLLPCFYVLWLLKTYSGIAYHSFTSGTVQHFFSSEASFFHAVHPWFPWACVLFSCCYFAANAYSHITYRKCHLERAIIQVVSFGMTYLWAVSPVIHRIYYDVYNGNVDDVTWMHANHILLVAIAGFFHGSGMPQKFFPGACDVIGHGHQIFHVVISTSLIFQLEASFADLQNGRHLDLVRLRPTDMSITAYLVVLFTSYGYITVTFVRKALSKANYS